LAVEHNKAVLISTHILTDVKTVCDSVVIMSGGRIHMVQPLEKLMQPARQGVQVWLSTKTTPAQVQSWESTLAAAGLQFDSSPDMFSYWVHDIDPSRVKEVWKVAEESGVEVQRMSQAKNSLEQIFFDVVKEAENAAA
jgi:ABC-type multidrug transport system ATPase subunit